MPEVYDTAIASHSSRGPVSTSSGSCAASKASYSKLPTRSPAPLYSLSQTSMTTGSRPCSSRNRRSACAMVGANSRSVMTTADSQWFICQASSGASSRVLSVFSTAFNAGTA